MLDTRLIMAWRALTAKKIRTCFTAFGLILGLLGFGTVLVAYFWLSNDLTENFLQTNPANIMMETDHLDEAQLAALENLPGVAEIEKRGHFAGQMEVRKGRWMPLMLHVVEDFKDLRVAKMKPDFGAWPPSPNTLLVERSGKVFLRDLLKQAPSLTSDVTQAPEIRISMFGGQVRQTRLAGLAFDAGQAPSPMEHMLYGYVTRATFESWFPEQRAQRYLITIAENPQDTAAAWQVAWRIQDVFRSWSMALPQIRVPDAGKHPHQFQLNAILILFAGLALLAFFLCAVLVVNLINAILAKQQRLMGVLKAVGATRSQVMAIYLGAMVLLGLLTSALAVPLAIRLGYGLARAIAAMLNFELLTGALPLWLPIAIACLGIVLPVLVAWWPVRRSVACSVSQALRLEGLSAQRTTNLFSSGWPGPMTLSMALRNNLRRPLRSGLTVATLMVGLTFFMAALNVRASLMQTAATVEATKKHDLRIGLRDPQSVSSIRKWGDAFEQIQHMEFWMSDRLLVEMAPNRFGNPVSLSLAPHPQHSLEPKILAGTWLVGNQPDGLVVNQKFMNQYPTIRVGQSHRFQIRNKLLTLRIQGVVKEFASAGAYLLKSTYDAHFDTADVATVVKVSLSEHSFDAQAEMARALQKDASQFGGQLGSIGLTQLMVLIVKRHLDIIAYVLGFVAFVMLLVGALGMGSGMSVNILERARELGVMRAMGSTRQDIRRLLYAEAAIMAGLAWLLALLVAEPVSRGISTYFGTLIVEYPFDYRHSYAGMALSLGIAFILAFFASTLPARAFLKRTVGFALRQD